MLQSFTLLLTFMALSGCTGEQPKSSQSANSGQSSQLVQRSIPTFSGKRSFDHLLKQVSFGPRNPNSAGHAACLAYLASELGKTTANVETQDFTHDGYGNERLQLSNLVAKFNEQAAQRILLCAHWDTRPRAEQDENTSKRNTPIPGANDGASGVAVLLEIARLLKDKEPGVGVDLVLFDGEDYGEEGDLPNYLLGSRFFALNLPPEQSYRFGILLDMVGDKYLEIPKEQHSIKYAPDVIDLVWTKAKELGYTQFVDVPGESIYDDHLPLNEVGIKTIDLIDFDYPDPTNRFWHTHQDTPENCGAESLEAVGTVLTHVIYSLTP